MFNTPRCPASPPATPKIPRAVGADHFTPEELREAAAFLAEYDGKIPKADSGPIVFPNAVGIQIRRALQRITEEKRRSVLASKPPDENCLTAAADDSVTRAAGLLSEHASRRDRSVDRFMSGLDEFLEPYLAIQNGMSLGMAARKYDIADIQSYVNGVGEWFDELGSWFRLRVEHAIEKRLRDATHRAGPEPPRVIKVGLPERGWNGIHIAFPPTTRAQRKRDRPWSGAHAPLVRQDGGPWWGSASVESEAAKTRDMVEEWQRTNQAKEEPSPEPKIDSGELHSRQLERGLIALLESMPHGPRSRELVRIVDMTKEGKSQREIANSLGLSRNQIAQRLGLLLKAGSSCPHSGLKVELELATPEKLPPNSVTSSESEMCKRKPAKQRVRAVY